VTHTDPAAAQPPAPSFEPVLGAESSLLGGVVGGLVGAVLASALWFGVVAITNWQIGLVAIVVGFVVGKAVVFGAGGRGSIPLVAVSAVFTLAALVVSEYLVIYHFISQEFGTEGLISVIQPVDFVVSVAVESVQADPVTLLFWGIALFQAVAIPWSAMRVEPQPLPVQSA
jgi:hypothetical protein